MTKFACFDIVLQIADDILTVTETNEFHVYIILNLSQVAALRFWAPFPSAQSWMSIHLLSHKKAKSKWYHIRMLCSGCSECCFSKRILQKTPQFELLISSYYLKTQMLGGFCCYQLKLSFWGKILLIFYSNVISCKCQTSCLWVTFQGCLSQLLQWMS